LLCVELCGWTGQNHGGRNRGHAGVKKSMFRHVAFLLPAGGVTTDARFSLIIAKNSQRVAYDGVVVEAGAACLAWALSV
jgi:hypothetical protein